MFCQNCGTSASKESSHKFCTKCGQPLSNGSNSGTLPKSSRRNKLSKSKLLSHGILGRALDSISPGGKKLDLRRIGLMALGGLVTLSVLAGGGFLAVNQYQVTESDNLELSLLFSETEIDELWNQSCTPAGALIIQPGDRELHDNRKKDLESLSKSPDARAALKFQDKNSWTSFILPDLDAKLNQMVSQTLDQSLATNPRIIEDSYQKVLEALSKELKTAVLEECGLKSSFESSASFTKSYNTAQAAFSAKADSAPWYPEGYFEIVDGLAGVYNTFTGSWPCSSCGFWKIKVIARDGCSGGVYVELNIKQNGVVVDWTNDTLSSLGPGGVGQMVFTNYPYIGGAIGEISEASCRN